MLFSLALTAAALTNSISSYDWIFWSSDWATEKWQRRQILFCFWTCKHTNDSFSFCDGRSTQMLYLSINMFINPIKGKWPAFKILLQSKYISSNLWVTLIWYVILLDFEYDAMISLCSGSQPGVPAPPQGHKINLRGHEMIYEAGKRNTQSSVSILLFIYIFFKLWFVFVKYWKIWPTGY